MKALLIVDCRDSLMWYNDRIGQVAPYLRRYDDEGYYTSREPSGYVNIVYFKDAITIEVPDESTLRKMLTKEI